MRSSIALSTVSGPKRRISSCIRRSPVVRPATSACRSPQFCSGMRQLARITSSRSRLTAPRLKSFLGGSRRPSWKISDARGVIDAGTMPPTVYENVGFSYNAERVVLRNISLQALPGQMIALAGPTGAGKSTLVNLLPAFYEVTSGRITIDGQDISGISLQSLRSHISVVSQEAFLFNGTIRENIAYGRLD